MSSVSVNTETEAPVAPAASGAYRRYVFGVLLLIYILNFLDRQVINILAEPIKRELHLADWQLGMMTGLAFAIFYTFLGLPIARLAEKSNRVGIISFALALWSLFTIACGFTQNFVQLLACRIGVGVGEAGCSPPSHSLISDYADKAKRASALAVYSMGIPLGTMLGMAMGGLVADAYGWRMALIVAGAPGLLLALVTLATVREPRAKAKKNADTPKLDAAIKELMSKKAFWWASIGAGFTSFVTYGHAAFYGSFFYRNHGDGVTALAQSASHLLGVEIGRQGVTGLGIGLIIGVAGLVGTYLGGAICDHFGARDSRAYVTIPALASFLGVPFAFLALFIPDTLTAMLLLAVPVLLKSFWYGPIFASAQGLVQPRTRATAAAVLLFLLNLIGLGIGPLAIGALSDVLAVNLGEAEGLRWAMALGSGAGLISVVCFLMASRTIRAEFVS